MECINLQNRFGDRYKIKFDPSYSPRNRPKHILTPWMMTLPCRFGIIYPFDKAQLCVEVVHHPVIAKRIMASGVAELYQDGDHEKSFLFLVSDFDQIAAIVFPCKRRQVSEKHRERSRRQTVRWNQQKSQPERFSASETSIQKTVDNFHPESQIGGSKP